MRKYTRLVLVFIIALHSMAFITGCSVNSPLFSADEGDNVVVVNYPPNRVSYGGRLDAEDKLILFGVIDRLSKEEYHDQDYNRRAGFNVDYKAKSEQLIGSKFEAKVNTKRRVK